MVGDDIAWIEFDENHQARVVNPRPPVRRGTGYRFLHQPLNAMKRWLPRIIFTNVALTDNGLRLVGGQPTRFPHT